MKICDRCHTADGSPVKATGGISFLNDDEHFDVCQSCEEKVREFITEPNSGRERTDPVVKKAKKGRPRNVPAPAGTDSGGS